MEDLISVIVPIYNVEEYLPRCIDSIINQTYKNLEIILVDDGSPDNCPKICDEYAKKDTRIKVIHKQNGGVSSARNAGLDNATGSYISFVDSDDWIDQKLYELLVNVATKNQSEMVCSGFVDCYVDSNKQIIRCPNSNTVVFTDEQILDNYYNQYFPQFTVPWAKLYKSTIFTDLRYNKMIYEDSEILFKIIHKVKSVTIIAFSGYYYQKRNHGLVNGEIKKTMVDSLKILCKNRVSDIEIYFPKFMYKEIAVRLTDIGSTYRRCKNKELKKELRDLFIEYWKKYKKYLSFKYKRTYKCYLYRILIGII